MNETTKFKILCECVLDSNFSSKVYLGIVNEGFNISYDYFESFIDESLAEFIFYNEEYLDEGFINILKNKVAQHNLKRAEKKYDAKTGAGSFDLEKARNAANATQQAVDNDNAKKEFKKQEKNSKKEANKQKKEEKSQNGFFGGIKKIVQNAKNITGDVANKSQSIVNNVDSTTKNVNKITGDVANKSQSITNNIDSATNDIAHMTNRVRKATDKINKKNLKKAAIGGAGIVAAGTAVKIAIDKMDKKKYQAWKAEKADREYISIDKWRKLGKPTAKGDQSNEESNKKVKANAKAYLEGYYDALYEIDNYYI